VFNQKKSLFEHLVRAYSAELYRYAFWLSRDRFTAEDLVQETFARAWGAWASLRDEGAARKWLYTILHNENARLFERKQLDVAQDEELDDLEDRRLLEGAYHEIELREVLHTLPVTYREPLLLQVLGGFSCDEIARLMNLTPGSVMTRLCRARLVLRKLAAAEKTRKASA
jgi:RNA polymerase sigma-70 factor, ECF subfamily